MVRRLAAILVADIVGYSRLMGADEAGTIRRLRNLRRDVDIYMSAGPNGPFCTGGSVWM